MRELRAAALDALLTAEPAEKAAAAVALAASRAWVDTERAWVEPPGVPGRPPKPQLVRPGAVVARSVATEQGRAALLHALAHIEFNAINLALDIVWRFAGLPESFYRDWARVAGEEAGHFSLLRDRLAELGCCYGDLPAHDGLWEAAIRTRGDLIGRLALVPRTLEARGLDASPAVRAKFASAGDAKSAQIVDQILRDEIGHVAIGNRWFKFVCTRAEVEAPVAHAKAIRDHGGPVLRGPFNVPARRAAGFTEEELQSLPGGSDLVRP